MACGSITATILHPHTRLLYLTYAFPLLIAAGPRLWFRLAKAILRAGGGTVSDDGVVPNGISLRLAVCAGGLLLAAGFITAADCCFFTFGPATAAFIVFCIGMLPLPVFSFLAVGSPFFWIFLSTEPLSTLTYPFDGGWPARRKRRNYTGILAIMGYFLGLFIDILTNVA